MDRKFNTLKNNQTKLAVKLDAEQYTKWLNKVQKIIVVLNRRATPKQNKEYATDILYELELSLRNAIRVRENKQASGQTEFNAKILCNDYGFNRTIKRRPAL